jgi:hypothetical protein
MSAASAKNGKTLKKVKQFEKLTTQKSQSGLQSGPQGESDAKYAITCQYNQANQPKH